MAISRRATLVGVNYYKDINPLYGCVNDAYNLKPLLERDGDGTKNFDVEIIASDSFANRLERKRLKEEVVDLFSRKYEIALFYFAGHGYVENTGGFLVTSDSKHGDDGFSMQELMKIVNDSPSTNKIVILDCCHAGVVGNADGKGDTSIINKGVTILAASDKDQYSSEINGSGVFTTLLTDALNGSAANLLGEITPGSVYAHIDQSLGAKQQRPLFKTNVESFISLRKVPAPVSLADLSRIVEFFPDKEEFQLDPSFEPRSSNPDTQNTARFDILQKYNRVNLVVPIGAKHMYDAAMESLSCKLTVLGEYYWNLVKNNRI